MKSLTRAEYSPKPIGHYALASEFYGHFTSPIRRYADLTVHRLLDHYFAAREKPEHAGGKKRKKKNVLHDVPTFDELVELGKYLGFTERRGDDAERELRQVKLLELLKNHIGEEFPGVVTGITNFGVFIQLQTYLIDGLIRYENLMDDWWDVDDKHGVVRGQRTGTKIGIGDQVIARIARVDPARRELDLAITKLLGKAGHPNPPVKHKPSVGNKGNSKKTDVRGGGTKRNMRSKSRGRRK